MIPLKAQIHLRIVPCRKKIIPSEEMVLIEQFAKKAKLHNNHGILFFLLFHHDMMTTTPLLPLPLSRLEYHTSTHHLHKETQYYFCLVKPDCSFSSLVVRCSRCGGLYDHYHHH